MKVRWRTIATKWKNVSNKWKIIGGLLLVIFVAIVGHFLRSNNVLDTDESLTERRIPVVLTPAAVRTFEQRVVVQGNVEAKEFAMVSPRVQGIIEAIFVDEGDSVIAGKTRLFKSDALKLEQTVEIQKNELSVAQFAKRQSAANLEKVTVDLNKSELDYKRFKRLFEKQAVTADAYEQQDSQFKQLQAEQKVAKAQLDLTAERVQQAEAALAISQKNLSDTMVYAPLTGKVSVRFQEPGEMGQPGQPVVRIDDTSVVEVSTYLPAQYYSKMIPGQTRMNVEVSEIDVGQQVISYRSPTIDQRLRTFEVKCVLKSPPEGVVPGAMAQIVIILESRKGLGVPSEAIQERGGRSVVFIIKDGTSHQVSVKSGLETSGWTEIIDGDVNEAASVVTMGQYMLDDGTEVSIQKEDN